MNIRVSLLIFLISITPSTLFAKDWSKPNNSDASETAPISDRPTPSSDLMRDTACLAMKNGTAKKLQESMSEVRKEHKDQKVNKIGIDLFVDLDGDEEPELATIFNSYSSKRYFGKNIRMVSAESTLNTDGVFGLAVGNNQPKSKEIRKIISGDINGDGVNDIAFIDYGEHDGDLHDGKIILLVSKESGHEWREIIPNPNKLRIHTGALLDVDNDNDLDLVIGAVGTKKSLFVFENDGNGNFKQTKSLKSGGKFGYGWVSYNATDLDNDGFHDLITDWRTKGHKSRGLQILWGNKRGLLKNVDPSKIKTNLINEKDELMSALPYEEGGERYLLAVFANYIGVTKILKLRFEGREIKSIEKIRDRSLIFRGSFGWANTVYPCKSGLKFFYSTIHSYELSSNVSNWK